MLSNVTVAGILCQPHGLPSSWIHLKIALVFKWLPWQGYGHLMWVGNIQCSYTMQVWMITIFLQLLYVFVSTIMSSKELCITYLFADYIKHCISHGKWRSLVNKCLAGMAVIFKEQSLSSSNEQEVITLKSVRCVRTLMYHILGFSPWAFIAAARI